MPTHLLKRGNNYYVRVAVPRSLRPVLGKAEVQRTTGTSDLRVAERRKHAIIADIQAEIELARDNDPASSSWLERQALALRKSVQRGELEADLAAELVGILRDKHLAAAKLDSPSIPETDPRVQRVVRASRLASDPTFKPLSQLIDEYVQERAPSVNKSTVQAMERELGGFAKWLPGDPSIIEVGRQETGRYVSEVLVKNGKAPKTNQDTLSFLSAFWNWAIRRAYYEKANPWDGLRNDLAGSKRGQGLGRSRRPWTLEEVGKLEGLPAHDPMYPMCLIALYSGMRLNEVAGLKLEDVNLEEGMFIVTEGKNQNSVRQVPVHPVIKAMVKSWHGSSTDEYLIPGLVPGGANARRGHSIAKRIGRWIRQNVSKDTGVCYHSLRNTFIAGAERAGIPESTTKLLVGHARQSLTYGLYSPGVDLPLLTKAIRKINYEGAA